MNIELTEQQARSVAEAARQGLRVMAASIGVGSMNPGDTDAAHKAVRVLDEAWQSATNRKR